MKILSLPTLVTCLFSTASLFAQDQSAKPGLELRRMAAWAGNWNYEGFEKENPMEPGGKFSGRLTTKPVLDGFFYQSVWEEQNPSGGLKGIEMHGFDSASKKYIFSIYESNGGVSSGTETFTNNQWIAIGTMRDNTGKSIQVKTTSVFTRDLKTVSCHWDYSKDQGKTWTAWLDFTMKKQDRAYQSRSK
jgi:hypothetical protein